MKVDLVFLSIIFILNRGSSDFLFLFHVKYLISKKIKEWTEEREI